MNIIVAPDSFKGSASALQLCSAMKEGIQRVWADAEVTELPLADGGEGTMEQLVYATQGSFHQVDVQSPLGDIITAKYGVLGDQQTAVIEIAQASGLPLLAEQQRNPLITSTYGTGRLRHALDQGYRQFIVGLGGSATNDGGAGMLQALGLRLEDEQGQPLQPGGVALQRLQRIDSTNLDSRLQQCRFEVACDVNNPLCGPHGASAIFGPQKGATPAMVNTLDGALLHYGQMLEQQYGVDVIDAPGAGAAGGLGAAFLGVLQAQLRPGIEMVFDAIGWYRQLQRADLILTGEGKLDGQTLSGKVIAGVCSTAKQRGIPVIALCGAMELTGAELDQLGLTAAFSIVKGPVTLDQAMQVGAQWTADQVEQLMRIWKTNINNQ